VKIEFVCPTKCIPGVDNRLVDALSRNQLEAFHNFAPWAVVDPISVPPGFGRGSDERAAMDVCNMGDMVQYYIRHSLAKSTQRTLNQANSAISFFVH